MNIGMEVQHDPYRYLLSQQEKQSARNIPFRVGFNGLAVTGAALYYITRHNEFGRAKALKITFDLVINVAVRSLFAVVVADQVSRRLFVNYYAMKTHQIAEYEIKKVMRFWPSAKPYLAPHQRPNSYFWC